MFDQLKFLWKFHKTTLILAFVLLAAVTLGFNAFKQFTDKKGLEALQEQDLIFDAEGPYALLLPRRDGNAMVLNLRRTASYDSISYELAYNSEGIDRGVVGHIDTKDKKGEYEQEILFGTCSKNVCKYDKDIENGTLTLHIRKGEDGFRVVTQWHLQKPDIALGILTSGDGHFTYKLDLKRDELANIGFTIINDLTGVPKLPEGKQVFGKVYALNVPIAKELPSGSVTLQLAEAPPSGAVLAHFDEGQSRWMELEGSFEGSRFSGKTESGGIFAVLVPSNK